MCISVSQLVRNNGIAIFDDITVFTGMEVFTGIAVLTGLAVFTHLMFERHYQLVSEGNPLPVTTFVLQVNDLACETSLH